jgi:four helix bundle protein
MSGIERFEDLIAWQKARWLTRDIYLLSHPFSRDFALCTQLRKSALSVPSNIAEGFERRRPNEFRQFLSVAKASCGELRSQLYTAYDVKYIDEPMLLAKLKQAEEVAKVIVGLRSTVK